MKFLYADTSTWSPLFPSYDGQGAKTPYDVDSVRLFTNSGEELGISKYYNLEEKNWRFGLSDFDFVNGVYGGRDTAFRKQRLLLELEPGKLDTLDIRYKMGFQLNEICGKVMPYLGMTEFFINGRFISSSAIGSPNLEIYWLR